LLPQGLMPALAYGVDSTGASKKFHQFPALNVQDFGAVPDAVDSGPAIQACLDAAFGPASNPNGNNNRFKNRPVYFPNGVYNTKQVLQVTGVTGGRIFGDGQYSTYLTYTGDPAAGNTIPQGQLNAGDAALLHAITPLFITNGFKYSSIVDMSFAMADQPNCVGVYIFWNGAADAGPTNNFYMNCGASGQTGWLIGYLSPGLCSEQTFIACVGGGSFAAFRNISQNALNNIFMGCGAASSGRGFSCPTGSVHIHAGSLAGNTVDIESGQDAMLITATRTESANFMTSVSGSSPTIIQGCEQSTGASLPGHFADGSINQLIIEGCAFPTGGGATSGMILGSGPLWLKGNEVRNPNFLNSYSGQVVEWAEAPNTVANLPVANARFRGLRRVVTDGAAATFGATVAPGGSLILPVWCDGLAWKVG
jgi:hypothetical protein